MSRGCGCAVVCLTALGVGACVAICGAIGFVGLVAPIFARRLTGGHPGRAMLPAGADRRAAAARRRSRRAARAARADAADRRGHRLARRALLPVAGRPYALEADADDPLLDARGSHARPAVEPTTSSSTAAQLVCLVGPNGSGKTSLLHALAGIGGADGDGADGRQRSAPCSARRRAQRLSPTSRPRATCAWPLHRPRSGRARPAREADESAIARCSRARR